MHLVHSQFGVFVPCDLVCYSLDTHLRGVNAVLSEVCLTQRIDPGQLRFLDVESEI